ncbi:aldo/keto reductase [Phyllobacterium leguminum]|uniref:Aryl-alcohol dehydrogenase-like predicted oxidoreductase n=1 Tax=Phyllobacterium leguminum TaxID=314237 RepID=A0A318TA52_9HYPH|nr:aldo/keto reductase [Phyllobacterium leguminum]PYE90537.1 aryl-alcohol dehydrogenase-like predicted oxidoreductase [Phyllobacterium leguminum]
MKMKPLGRTGINVTEICLGTMTWGVQNTEAEAHAQLDYAIDAGINFIDTAEAYAVPIGPETYGKTETYIGNWLKRPGKRDKIVLATKIAGGGGQHWIRDGSAPNAKTVRIALEGSLKRLQTDYIDLYQIHWPARPHYNFGNSWNYDPTQTDRAEVLARMEEVLESLGALVKEGKIRHVGLSNETAWGTMQWLRLAEQKGLPRMASLQNEYGLLQRHFDLDMAELCHHEDVGLLAYSTLAAGVLTGKYLDGKIPAGSRATVAKDGFWRKSSHSEPAVRRYVDLAREHGLDPADLAIAFSLSRPFMTSVIIGATSLDQLKADIAAADIILTADDLAEIAAIHRDYPRPI